MKKIILFAFSAFLALLAGCTADSFAPVAIPNHYSVKPPEPVNERDLTEQLKKLHTPDTSPYKITPGDQFDITVYEHPELTVRQIIVTPDGFVSAPLIGPVKIGGLSLVEATEALKKQIAADAETRKAQLNKLADKLINQPAQRVQTPAQEIPQGEFIEHTVEPGTTLSALSKAYGVTVSDIKKANRLSSDNIRVGQKLLIPVKR